MPPLTSNALLLAIDKPETWTSFDVVAFLRKGLHIKRIGHAGTLDPFATGLLLVAVERAATRRIDEFSAQDKTYLATVRFGLETDTLDRTGTTTGTGEIPDEQSVLAMLPSFLGELQQIPPQYSAIKVNGRRAYDAARKGETTELKARSVRIESIELISWNAPDLTVRIVCSKGTYIRSMARDFGHALNTVATLQELRRERIGEYSIDSAVSPQVALDSTRDGNWDFPFVLQRWQETIGS